jgi:hypothetical protein
MKRKFKAALITLCTCLSPLIAQGPWRDTFEYRSSTDHYWLKLVSPISNGKSTEESWKAEFGIFRWGFVHSRQSRFNLVEKEKPWKVLVSSNGDRVVTISHLVHRGNLDSAAINIYRIDGSLIRAVSLSDIFTPSDLEVIAEKLGAVVFDGELPQEEVIDGRLDEAHGVLLIKAAEQGINTPSAEFPVSLENGQLLAPLKDRLWHRRFFTKVVPERLDGDGIDLFGEAIDSPLPEYSLIQKAAKVRGLVVSEMEVAADGMVVRVKAISGPPLLFKSAEKALSTWRFRASNQSRLGRVALRFGVEETRP